MRRFSRVRSGSVGVVLACALTVFWAVPASARSTSNYHPNSYLSLGDSVTFGYNPILVKPGVNPDVFVGFPQLAAALSQPKLKVSNASCPGETSTSLISGTRPDNGCQDYREFIGALHVSYAGSQLQYAARYVAANPGTKLVSLMIGANDSFLLQHACEQKAPASVNSCIVAGLPRLLTTLRANIRTIYKDLRRAGFTGEFVAVTYYSLNYRDWFSTLVISALNIVLADVTKRFDGKVADGFTAFAHAAAGSGGDSCAAGLLIRLTPNSCDIHPSPAGAALLAAAVRSTQRLN